jgi:hypothetical protein
MWEASSKPSAALPPWNRPSFRDRRLPAPGHEARAADPLALGTVGGWRNTGIDELGHLITRYRGPVRRAKKMGR